ncbi:hypothetical protein R3P38DRAFT_880584 [Favolaschia claudopus]|uniref:Uncharacterized protein n=1 Tax=Favolaschia claudopus TaxID=2862362 RepID=A0AAW0BSD1_9AGAR
MFDSTDEVIFCELSAQRESPLRCGHDRVIWCGCSSPVRLQRFTVTARTSSSILLLLGATTDSIVITVLVPSTKFSQKKSTGDLSRLLQSLTSSVLAALMRIILSLLILDRRLRAEWIKIQHTARNRLAFEHRPNARYTAGSHFL